MLRAVTQRKMIADFFPQALHTRQDPIFRLYHPLKGDINDNTSDINE